MMKISALNVQEASEESEDDDVPKVSKEAQEQIALTEYNRALELLRDDKTKSAMTVFQDLLETELLDSVEKPETPDGRARPLLSLKYSCYKNIAMIQAKLENFVEAIDNYCAAACLDDSDVTLWLKIGCLAMKTLNLELACNAFKQGLKCNPNHWPSLDNLITCLYAVPDYMNCLLYISIALEQDPSYVKGLAFRSNIFKSIPDFEEYYKVYNSDWSLDPPTDTEFDHVMGDKFLEEAMELRGKWSEFCAQEFISKPLPNLSLRKPLTKYTWLDVGECLIDMHKHIVESNLNFVSKINLEVQEETTNSMQDESIVEVIRQETGEENQSLSDEAVIVEDELKKGKDNCNLSDGIEENHTHYPMEIDEERKSCGSDIEIIEEEDPLKVSDSEAVPLDNHREKEEQMIVDLDDNVTPSNDKMDIDQSPGESNNKESNFEETKTSKTEVSSAEERLDEREDKQSEKSNDRKNENSRDKCDDKSNGKEEGQKVKKRRRSSLCFLQQWAWSGASNSMRRSARNRGSSKREAERDDILVEETLKKLFPSALLPENVRLTKDDNTKSADDSMDTMDLYELFTNREEKSNGDGTKSCDSSKPPSPSECDAQKYFDTELEKADVEDFIAEHSGKSNYMVIIAKFTEFLCTKWNQKWPKQMSDVYLQTFAFTREHIPHASPFADDSDDNILSFDTEMTLLFGELHTDKWLNNKPDIIPTSTLDKFSTGIPSEELGFIIFASVRNDYDSNEGSLLLLRTLWLKANIFLCQGDTEVVIETLELLLEKMKEMQSYSQLVSLRLPNCGCNSNISITVVEKRLNSIQRGQKLGEIASLYENKRYAELVKVLQDTFKFAKHRTRVLTNNEIVVERDEQLAMLLDSLLHLQEYEACYVWGEACLNEAWQNFLNATEESEQKKWIASVVNALEKLNKCTEEVSTFVVKHLSNNNLSRLVQNLVQIVCHQLDVPDTAIEMPLETVLPWILLHYILLFEEDKERARTSMSQKNKQEGSHCSESEEEEEDVPASLMVLFTAHEFLGRHSWCCINEARLLYFTMQTIIPKLKTPQLSGIKKKLIKYLEQIFYCLYGHPNRPNKAKPKHLEDHGVPHMELTWDKAQLLFDFYKPECKPNFESRKNESINPDTEALFKKITSLVPPESDPSKLVDEMNNYIAGERDKMPAVKKPLPSNISCIYYLLADYYFKSSKWGLAIRFSLMDLCIDPKNVDSWVDIAMSTGTEIETWINSYRPQINVNKFLAKAKVSQYCYKRAIELLSSHPTIWTEYGNFAYMVYSFCSRLLKQESDTFSMERFEFLENRKEEMLVIAGDSFESAYRIYIACHGCDDNSHIQDERWLHQYMLAKISEKKNEDLSVVLEHYAKACRLLQENDAQYPSRVSHKAPPNLSIEALEVHYRIHACILKSLEQHEGKKLKASLGLLFEKHLRICAEGPFVQYPSKLSQKAKENSQQDQMVSRKGDESRKHLVTIQQRSNSIEEVEITDKINEKSKRRDSRKRLLEETTGSDSKRVKLGGVSHLQLMQDVVALIDELITNVCDIVSQKDTSSDELMTLSSDEYDENKTCVKKVAESNVDKVPKKTESFEDMMEVIVRRAIENPQTDEDDEAKANKKPMDKESKVEENRKVPGGVIMKSDGTMGRRDSQESTTTTHTTTTTETNNTSSSSSDESSSSEDSSDSESSSDSDSETGDSENEKEKKEKDGFMAEEEVSSLIALCLAGLEQVVLRFPEHFKSIYRLAHFYFNNKSTKDLKKCEDLLLGTYSCQYYPGQTFPGLFSDKKATNFFNNIWHIPNQEIDRPGSFASHMSRCVTLLMQVLKETNNSRMLMELCVQLYRTPEPDKKYLREPEREQLSGQALTLCIQSLRSRIQAMGPANSPDVIVGNKNDPKVQVLIDVYKNYQQAQKHLVAKESAVQNFANLLCEAYKVYTGTRNVEGNVLDIAQKYCQRQITAIKQAAMPNNTATTFTATANISSSNGVQQIAPQLPPALSVSHTAAMQPRKPYKPTTSALPGRPRGRPPNVNKNLQGLPSSSLGQSQYNTSKSNFANWMSPGLDSQTLMSYYLNPMNSMNSSMVDPAMVSAMLNSPHFKGNMMEQIALNWFNQIGNYQNIMQQAQNNIALSNLASGVTGLPNLANISSVPTMSTSSTSTAKPQTSMGNMNNLTVQQLLNMNNARQPNYQQATAKNTVASSSTTKDRPDISITPVNSNTKISKPLFGDVSPVKPAPQSSQAHFRPVIHPSSSRTSVLKSSVAQPKPPASSVMSGPQIRVAKNLMEHHPQPAHNAGLLHSPVKNSQSSTGATGSIMPSSSHSMNPLSITPMNAAASQSGTSLQHKLLSKKQPQQQQLPQPMHMMQQARKQKPKKPTPPSNYPGLLGSMNGAPSLSQSPYNIPTELSNISVSAIAKNPTYKKPKPKDPTMESMVQAAETMSMLSQLNKHRHLEIIPQQKSQAKPPMDYGKSLQASLSVVPQNITEPQHTKPQDPFSAYEANRNKPTNVPKKSSSEKVAAKDSVEIITLDD